MPKQEDYSVFRPNNNKHKKVGQEAEQILSQIGEIKTRELAEKIESKMDSLKANYIRTILTDASTYFVDKHEIEIDPRPEDSGGNLTYYWKGAE